MDQRVKIMTKIDLATHLRTEMIDITSKVEEVVRKSGVENGVCYLFVPHTTAGITINENADPTVTKDILAELNKIIPFDDHYQHLEGNSAAHIKASLTGSSEVILIEDGSLVLGTWQGIYFAEFDGPRRRKVLVKVTK